MTKEQKLDEICESVCLHFGVGKADMKSKYREEMLVAARVSYAFIAYNVMGYKFTTTEIGRLLNRNHSTIVHYLKQVIDDRGEFYNKRFARTFDALKKRYISELRFEATLRFETVDNRAKIKEYLMKFAEQNVKWTDEHEKLVDRFMNSHIFEF